MRGHVSLASLGFSVSLVGRRDRRGSADCPRLLLRGRTGPVFWAPLLVLASGCAAPGALSRDRVAAIGRVLGESQKAGAYACAPKELALASANLAFGRTELEQGDLGRADDHLRAAEKFAGDVWRLTESSRCRSLRPVAVASGWAGDGDGSDTAVHAGERRCPGSSASGAGADAAGCPQEAAAASQATVEPTHPCPGEGAGQEGCPSVPDGEIAAAGDLAPEDVPAISRDPSAADGSGVLHKSGLAEITTNAIRVTERIRFQAGKALILSISFPVLDAVAEVLMGHRQISVEVQGHTDSAGSEQRNLRLSQERADSVRHYLIERGIDPGRLTARGYGETRPVESNRTSRGRAANRRMEFVRTDRAGQGGPAR